MLLVGGLLCACGVLELAARLSAPIHPQGWFVAGPSDDRYFVPAPGLTYAWGGATFHHGPLGTPQGDATPESQGRPRVAFVGDSVCYGFMAAGEDNLTRRVEAALGPEHVQTLNFGVPGYNAHMISATLREQVLEFGPAAVIYVFHQNDLTNASHADAFRARPALFRERYDLPAPLWRRTLGKSRALTFLLDRVRISPEVEAPPSDPPPTSAPTSAPTPVAAPRAGTSPEPPPSARSPRFKALRRLLLEEGPHRRYFKEHLSAMREACARRKVPFALLFVPLQDTLRLDPSGEYRDALRSLCAELQVPFLDGQAAFAAHPAELLYGDPGHPNPRGHQALADTAVTWLRGALP